MIIAPWTRFTFENISIVLEGQTILNRCDFKFPLQKNVRVACSDPRVRFGFFHALSQIEGFTEGAYQIDQQNILDLTFEEFIPIRRRMGFGFSTRGLLHNLTLQQNLELPLRYHQVTDEEDIKDRVLKYAEYFMIEKELKCRPADVSASTQKAVLILRAFVHHPEMIFLDSPEMMMGNHLHGNLLQLVADQKKYHNLQHLYFSTQDEVLAECLAEESVILHRHKLYSTEEFKQRGAVA